MSAQGRQRSSALGAWATPKTKPATCGSAEGQYRAEPAGPAGARGPITAETLRRVHLTLQALPMPERKLLGAEYTHEGRRAGAMRRELALTWRQWREPREVALRRFAAGWVG